MMQSSNSCELCEENEGIFRDDGLRVCDRCEEMYPNDNCDEDTILE